MEDISHTTDTTKELRPLRNIKELCSLDRIRSVFRRFVPQFACISASLNRKLQRGQPKGFVPQTVEEAAAMEELNERSISPPILALPCAIGHHTLETDAHNVQSKYALLQEQPDITSEPVGYWSGSLTKTEQTYESTQWEWLAIVWSILILHLYSERNRRSTQMGYNRHKWILNLVDGRGR